MANAAIRLQWWLILVHLLSTFITITPGTIDVGVHDNGTQTPAPWIVTGTLSVDNLNNVPSSAPIAKESILVLHFICFAVPPVSISNFDSPQEEIAGCCNAIHDAMLQQQELLSWRAPDDNEMNLVRFCQRKKAVIPTAIQTPTLEQPTALFSLVISCNIRRDHDLSSRLLVYNPKSGRSLWTHDDRSSPFRLPEPVMSTIQEDNDLKNHRRNSQQQQQQQGNVPHCHVESQLSETGGMHRTLHNRISCVTNPRIPSLENTPPQQQKRHGRVHVALWIPDDMWFDVNDAFSNNMETCAVAAQSDSLYNSTCHATIVTDQYRGNETHQSDVEVMDIEATAFESPQYVIPMQIDFFMHDWNDITTMPATFSSMADDKTKSGLLFVLEVTTKLHLRYPQPIRRRRDNSLPGIICARPWRRVVFPAPTIYYLSLDGRATAFEWQVANDHTPPRIVTFVAAAYEDDCFWVMTITMACSILGSMFLLREILQVSQWT